MTEETKETKVEEAAHEATICVDDLHDPRRWWHLLKVYKGLREQHGLSTGLDLRKKLNSGELPCVHRPANSDECKWLETSFWPDCELEENHGNSADVQLKNQPASMLPGGVTYVTGMVTGRVGWAPAYLGGLDTLGLDVVTPWGRFDAREFYVRQEDCVKIWPAELAPQATKENEPEENKPEESERGKTGPRAANDWQTFVAMKYCTDKYSGRGEPAAPDLAEACGHEFGGWKPDPTAINLLRRKLRKILG
jgi:hypothetical protein